MAILKDERGEKTHERRGERRSPRRTWVKFRWILDKERPFGYRGSQSFLYGRIVDISSDGAGMEIFRQADVEDLVEVYVPHELFWGRAEVRHVKSLESDAYRVGVKFLQRYAD